MGADGRRRSGPVRAVLALVLVVLAVAVMVRLSLWQWHKARAHGALLNYTYAVEWLVFAGLTVAGVVRLALEGRRDAVRSAAGVPSAGDPPPAEACPAPVPLVGPPLRPGEELEEVTWIRLRRRLGLDAVGQRVD